MRSTECSTESGFEIAIGCARGSSAGSAAAAAARVGEAQGDDPVEAEVADHVLGAAAQRLLAGSAPPPGARRRQRRRQVLGVAVDAADLLDQVDLAGDVVVAVERDRRLEVVAVLGRPRTRAAAGTPPGAANGIAIPSTRSARAAAQRAAGARVGISAATSIVPGTSVAPQSSTISCEATRCARIASSGWSCFSNAVRGVGAQPELARGAQDVDPVPGRDLEQHARGRLADLGDLAAHDPGDPGRPVAVADEDGVGVEAAARRRRAWSSSRPRARCGRSARRPAPCRGRTRAAAGRSSASRSW